MQRKRIVLVDDSETFLAQMASFLSDLPEAEVIATARSGREALSVTSRVRADLILMDLAMPDMNGVEATRRLKARTDAPIVWVVTLQDDAESRDAALRAGANEFVPKQRLLTRLLEYLEPGPEVPPKIGNE